MVRCAPSVRVPTSMTVVTGCWLSNWNSHPTRTRIADPSRDGRTRWRRAELAPGAMCLLTGAEPSPSPGWDESGHLSMVFCTPCRIFGELSHMIGRFWYFVITSVRLEQFPFDTL